MATNNAVNVGIVPGGGNTYTFPSANGTLATLANSEALTNKTYNGNTWTAGTGTLTLAASKILTVNNTLTLAGTDGTTMTFPTTSATIARTDAANTFTGHQTIEGVTSTGATGTGKFVFDNAPTITGHPVVEGVTSTGATGTGKFVFDGTPTIATPSLTSPTLTGTPVLDSTSAVPFYSENMSRQALLNGNFNLWQRGTSVALADITFTYEADRWQEYVDKNGGTLPTLTRSRQALTAGDLPNSFYFSRLNTNGAGTSLGVSSFHQYGEKIEGGTRLLCGAGKTVTFSIYIKSDIANKRIGCTMIQNYGTGGAPTAAETITGSIVTVTSSWVKYTWTFTTNTLVGKTFGTANDDFLFIKLIYMWGTTSATTFFGGGTAETYVGSGNIDIAQGQVNEGSIALPFQPKPLVRELLDCQRYYETGIIEFNGYDGAGQACAQQCRWKVTKRIAPTVTQTNTAATNCGVGTNQNVISVDGFQSYRVVTALGHAQYSESWTASAEL